MRGAIDLFSDIFALRDNTLTRLDPRVKLLGALATILAVVLSKGAALPATALALGLAVLIGLRLPPKLLAVRMAAPMSIAAVVCVMRAFVDGSTPLFTVWLFGWELTATEEGAVQGLLMAGRVMASVSVMIALGVTTPAHKVFAALRWCRMPKGWVEIAMLMYRYIFALIDHVGDVFAAQRIRLGYVGARRSLRSMGTLMGSVLLRSMDQATRTHEAMRLRGYRGDLPTGHLPRFGWRNGRRLGAYLLALTLAFALLEGGLL
ncbi:cobalt ECF transporter T component CbiQ [bacterium]|nr:cobalt ECF transporter T component CbiQ [bacterium]